MTDGFKTLIAAAVLVVPIAAAPALYAQDSGASQAPSDSMMKPGMMGGGSMMNMMGGTSQMQDMMDHCSQMMNGGATKPNEQWRNNAPAAPDDQD
jgi:hypothetical protein